MKDVSEYLERINEATAFIRSKLPRKYENPQFGIICGSGLGDLGRKLRDPINISYSDIPGFPVSTVSGHKGLLAVGLLGSSNVMTVCMIGRFHFYEGYELDKVTFPVRVLSRLGISTLLVTNAAGGLDPQFNIGDVMAIEDHISFPNLAGINALRGPNIEEFGPRFTALTRIYLKNTFELLKQATEAAGYESDFIRKGVYCAVGGPTYETPAEIRMLRLIGGSSVGMSTVPEIVSAVHSGIPKLLAFSLISNRCISHQDENIVHPTHAEVLETSQTRVEQLEKIVEKLSEILFAI